MPFDDADIAQMRAYLLKQQEPQQPVYDDGASMLGHDENFMPVGLFGKGPKPTKMAVPEIKPTIDMQRRSLFGLPESPTFQPPAVIPKAQTADLIPKDTVPEVVPQPSSPLTDLANKAINTPMSRRDVLNKAKNAAVSHVVRGAIGDVIPTELPKLPDVAKAAKPFVPNPVIDDYLQTHISNNISDIASEYPFEGISSAYGLMKDHLKGRIDDKELLKADKLHNKLNNAIDNDLDNESVWHAQEKLDDFVHDNLKHLKPHELHDLLSDMYEYEAEPEELYDQIGEERSGIGINEAFSPEELKNYLDHSYETRSIK